MGDHKLEPGLTHTFRFTVTEEQTVPNLFPGSEVFGKMPAVLATGYFVGLCEWACMEAMAPFQAEGDGSVGTMINVTHTAPTLPGMEVTIQVICLTVDGKRTLWEIEARDEKDPIGRGKHERFSVKWDRFHKMLEEKKSS
jgi:fluoroacetyl-CoA thioesterase